MEKHTELITYNKRMPSCHQLHPQATLLATKDKHVQLITLICARACNTHLRWGFLVPTYCLQWILAMTGVGAFFFFQECTQSPFWQWKLQPCSLQVLKKHFLTRTHQPSVSVKTAGALCPHHDLTHLVVSSKWHCTHYVAWIAGTHGFVSRVFWLFAMISSKSCKVFNIFL